MAVLNMSLAQNPPCQRAQIYFDTLNCSPQPLVEDGILYFNLCKGDSLKLQALTEYPENYNFYTQHDSLHSFRWSFTDDDLILTEGINHAAYKYTEVNGYDISISLIDSNDCSSNTQIARVRIAGNPITGIGLDNPYCHHDTISISTATIGQVIPYSYEHTSTQKFEEETFLPDGPDCFPGYYYTDVVFSAFLPDQIISAPEDIVSVCVNMEHTYMGDLSMYMICPNGQTVMLKKQIQYNHRMGEPAGMPNPRSMDNPNFECLADSNPPGIGWNYCWSELYPNTGSINDGAVIGSNQLDSTYISTVQNYFAPDNSFAGLVGCPLNGLWTIKIRDTLNIDNGYIFEWTLNLDENLLPPGWSYFVDTDSIIMSGVNILSTNNSQTIIAPPDTGTYQYTYTVIDDYGCHWDTLIPLVVAPLPDYHLPADDIACPDIEIDIVGSNCPFCSYLWSTGENTAQISTVLSGIIWCEVTDTNSCSSRDTMVLLRHPKPPPINIYHE